jgi:hypothetical protein
MTKRTIKAADWITFLNVDENVPEEMRKDPKVWKSTLARWIESSGIPNDEIMSATKKFTDIAPRGKNPAKKHVIIPYDRLVEKLEGMLIGEPIPVDPPAAGTSSQRFRSS